MSPTKTSRLRRFASHAKEIWAELDHAQRRQWEIRTAMPGVERQQRRERQGSQGRRSLSGAGSS
jgi:hypothetical protein